MQFRNFLEMSDVLGAKLLEVRVADNVLDDEDYTVEVFAVENGRLRYVGVAHEGSYVSVKEDLDGRTLEEFLIWTQYDRPAAYPENYHEARVVEASAVPRPTILSNAMERILDIGMEANAQRVSAEEELNQYPMFSDPEGRGALPAAAGGASDVPPPGLAVSV